MSLTSSHSVDNVCGRAKNKGGIENKKLSKRQCCVCLEDFDNDKTLTCPWGCKHVSASCTNCTLQLMSRLMPCPLCRCMWTVTINCATSIIYMCDDDTNNRSAVALQSGVLFPIPLVAANVSSQDVADRLPMPDTVLTIVKMDAYPLDNPLDALVYPRRRMNENYYLTRNDRYWEHAIVGASFTCYGSLLALMTQYLLAMFQSTFPSSFLVFSGSVTTLWGLFFFG
jgi:hypothetical protein